MDLTTLTMAFMLAVAAIGADTVWHPSDVILETSAAGKLDKASIDVNMINVIVEAEINRVSSTPSLMAKPRVQLGHQGIGMALASAANMQSVAYALQNKVGYQPDQIKIALFSEDGIAKVLVTGSGRERVGTFEQQVEQQKGESVIGLLHRSALIGMARIDPYLTALSLLQRHSSDKDFTDAETLIAFAKSQLPPTPASFERSLYENLQGILALFRGNQEDAHTWFRLAMKSSPANTAAALNLAFADLQLGHHRETAERMERLLRTTSSTDTVLLGTAYMTWGAARLGLHDVNGADHMLAKAIEVNPRSALAWDLWADVKREKGDQAGAARLHQRALDATANFENYGEVATLYFRLAWQDHQPVTRSNFANPATVGLH